MRENVTIQALSPATDWYALYGVPGKPDEFTDTRVLSWAAISYDDSTAQYTTAYPGVGFQHYQQLLPPTTISEVVGTVFFGGSVEFADEVAGFAGYSHKDDMQDTIQRLTQEREAVDRRKHNGL